MKKNSIPSLFLVALLVGGLGAIDATFLNTANASTTVNSMIITSDTTWTKGNSPYELTRNVLIESGVIVTVEADAVVNFNLGKVNYTPFLTEQNLQATPDLNAPIPLPDTSPSLPPSPDTSSPSENPAPDQNGNPTIPQTDFYEMAIASFLVILGIALLVVRVVLTTKKTR